jgi:hypothetical protein
MSISLLAADLKSAGWAADAMPSALRAPRIIKSWRP